MSLSSSMAAATSSKPPSTAPQDRDPQWKTHVDAMAKLGIKVRDFAYESTLPKVRTIHTHVQVQPGPMKRTRGEGEAKESSSSSKKAKLERMITEPDIQSINPPVRARGFANLDDYEPETESQLIGVSSQQSDWPSSQPPPTYFDSQDSEPHIDTPLVTPNGSLQWRVLNNSSVPASQLDAALQNTLPELFSYGPPQPKDRTGLVGELTPMSSLSSIFSDPPTSPIALPERRKSRAFFTAPKHAPPLHPSPRPVNPPALAGSSLSPISVPRYQLRKRPAPTPTPIKPTSRKRLAVNSTLHPSSRPHAFSIQSSHSRTKPKNAPSSPRTRTLRKRADPDGRDETLMAG